LCQANSQFKECFVLNKYLTEISTGKKLKATSLQICELISFCSTNSKTIGNQADQNLSHLQEEITCSLCEAILTMVKASNGTKINTHQLLTTICDKAPLIIQDSCNLFIKTYTNLIENGLNSNDNPLQICKSIKICSLTVNRTNQFHALALFNSFISSTVQQDGAQCQACQWVVSAVEAYLAQDTTEIELSRVFATLCTVLPGVLSDICQNFVLVYMSEVVGYIIDNLTPPYVCDKLSLCNTV